MKKLCITEIGLASNLLCKPEPSWVCDLSASKVLCDGGDWLSASCILVIVTHSQLTGFGYKGVSLKYMWSKAWRQRPSYFYGLLTDMWFPSVFPSHPSTPWSVLFIFSSSSFEVLRLSLRPLSWVYFCAQFHSSACSYAVVLCHLLKIPFFTQDNATILTTLFWWSMNIPAIVYLLVSFSAAFLSFHCFHDRGFPSLWLNSFLGALFWDYLE